jgi:xanthine dehydrogenase accessory factor
MRISERAQQLLAARTPFVHATVVRAQPPTSAYPGDEAILLADGTIEGFVGGQCAQNSVRKAALGALQAGESVLLRVLPDGDVHFPEAPGACVVVNPCLSGGSLEIFLTPQLPSPLIRV